MTIETPARPDLAAQRQLAGADLPTVVRDLAAILGKKLTAYIGSAKDTRAVDRWIVGNLPCRDAEDRLRFAYRVVRVLGNGDDPQVIQAWLTGLNPELYDRSPIRMIREEVLEDLGPQILAAAKAFLAGA